MKKKKISKMLAKELAYYEAMEKMAHDSGATEDMRRFKHSSRVIFNTLAVLGLEVDVISFSAEYERIIKFLDVLKTEHKRHLYYESSYDDGFNVPEYYYAASAFLNYLFDNDHTALAIKCMRDDRYYNVDPELFWGLLDREDASAYTDAYAAYKASK